jgi:imidazolonepropionase-like amidohydrolase
MKRIYFVIGFATLIFSCTSPQHDLLITNVNIIDVVTGEVLSNRTVAIDGDSISAIYNKSIKPGKHTEVVDGTGKYLIPGLWDMHVHNNLNYEYTNDLLLANGVTGAREMWGDMTFRKKMDEERVSGKPIIDIYSAGVIIDGVPRIWPGSDEVISPEEAISLVKCQVEQGADFIKIYSLLDKACFDAIAQTSKELGVPFAGHVPRQIPIRAAAAAGMQTMEHLFGLEELAAHDSIIAQSKEMKNSFSSIAATHHIYSHLDTTLLDAALLELQKSGVWMSPTMTAAKGQYLKYNKDFISDKRVEYLPGDMIFEWNPYLQIGPKPDSIEIAKREDLWKFQFEMLKALVRTNTPIIAGTDYPNPWTFPGFSLHDELEMYVEAGMSPLQALQTATLNPSKLMKNEKIGTVKKGNLASLVLLNQNPLEDINAVRAIESVVLRGKIYKRDALDSMLENTIRRAGLPDASVLIDKLKEEGNLPNSLMGLSSELETLGDTYNLMSLGWEIYGLAMSYMNNQEFENAILVLQSITQLYPNDQYAWSSYADGFLTQGDTLNAVQYYQKALDIYPCNLDIQKKLTEISSK